MRGLLAKGCFLILLSHIFEITSGQTSSSNLAPTTTAEITPVNTANSSSFVVDSLSPSSNTTLSPELSTTLPSTANTSSTAQTLTSLFGNFSMATSESSTLAVGNSSTEADSNTTMTSNFSVTSSVTPNQTQALNETIESTAFPTTFGNITETEAAETTAMMDASTAIPTVIAITAQATTTASLTSPTTTQAVCLKPISISSGSFSPVQETYSIGSKVTYSCEEGLLMACSAPTVTCTSAGTWSVSSCFPGCSSKAPTGSSVLRSPYLIPIVAIVCGVVGFGFLLLFIGCLAVKCCSGKKEKSPKVKSVADMPRKDRKTAGISVYHLGDDLIKVSTDSFKSDPNLFKSSEEISLHETPGSSGSGSRQTIITTDLDSKAEEAAADKNGNT